MDRAKPFDIPKREVWEAYKRVRANQGAAGGQLIADFEADLSNNLYKIWNRMSSGSYFPPPVRRVDIPKGETGGTRPLGIPTVADRVAQMVVKRVLEPLVEPHFHDDMDTGPANRRSMLWVRRGSDAGATPGSSISTSRPFSTVSRRICLCGQFVNIRPVRGCCCTSRDG